VTTSITINWDELTLPSGDKLIGRKAFPERTDRLLYAIDSSGFRHLLITSQLDDKDFQDCDSRGVSITTRDLTIHGNNTEKYIDITCLDSTGFDIFNLIGEEIGDQLTNSDQQPSKIVSNVINKWRRFWGQVPKNVLSKEMQIGLFSELWFLSTWLIPNYGPDSTLYWRGPWGYKHDFQMEKISIEIKGTLNSRGHIHRISSLDQLESPETGRLFLSSILISEDYGSKLNLPHLIDLLNEQLKNSIDAINHFENGLSQIGYSPIYQEEYSKLKMKIIECYFFEVNDQFPRITKSAFQSTLPNNIESIEYVVNINGFLDNALFNSPDGFYL